MPTQINHTRDQQVGRLSRPQDTAYRPNASSNREEWLTQALQLLTDRVFKPAGYDVPNKVRLACSWPSRGGLSSSGRVLGQAWCSTASADGHFEIVISYTQDDATRVLDILVHETVHVVVGISAGHRAPFKRCAIAVGLEGKMTSTVAGASLEATLRSIAEVLGPYPHARLDPALTRSKAPVPDEPLSTGSKPQKARLLKAKCGSCGLILRLTRKWVEGKRLVCPDEQCGGHKEPLQIQYQGEK